MSRYFGRMPVNVPFLKTGVVNSRPREAQTQRIWTNYTLFESGRLILKVGKIRKSARRELAEKNRGYRPPVWSVALFRPYAGQCAVP